MPDSMIRYLEYPSFSKNWPFTLQGHSRGKSLHFDLRMQVNEDELVGWTLVFPTGEESQLDHEPADLREANQMMKSAFHDKFLPLITNPLRKILSIRKGGDIGVQPTTWMNIGKGGGSHFPPGSVGATRFTEGFIVEMDSGVWEAGAKRPDFQENFLYGNDLRGRFVTREFPKEQIARDPALAPKLGRDPFIFFTFMAKDDRPWVLSKRAVEVRKWMPPQGFHALPKFVAQQIPPLFRYWTIPDQARARDSRNQLVEEISHNRINLDFEKGFKAGEIVSISGYDEGLRAKFVLQRHVFKGQQVVRAGVSQEHWDLRIDVPGEKSLRHWVLDFNPVEEKDIPAISGDAVEKPTADKSWMQKGASGAEEIPPGTPGNPFKKANSRIEREDSGDVVFLNDGEDLKKMEFHGRRLTGAWILIRQEPGGDLWFFRKSEGPGSKLDEFTNSH